MSAVRRSPLGILVDLVLSVGAIAIVLGAAAPFLHPLWPRGSVAAHFGLQVLLGALFLLLVAMLRRRWLSAGAMLVCAVVQVAVLQPYLPRLGSPAVATGATAKIVLFNVWARNTAYGRARDYLAESDADIIALVEATPEWRRGLAGLDALYPHRADCAAQSERCRMVLLSRLPLAASGLIDVKDGEAFILWADLAMPAGAGQAKRISLALTHLKRPYALPEARGAAIPDGLPRVAQAQQIAALVPRLATFAPDAILMGDFNAAPWSAVQQGLRRPTGFDNAGFLAPSWPAWLPAFLRLPIDHVMVRGSLSIRDLAAGPELGSDHRPVEATVELGEAP